MQLRTLGRTGTLVSDLCLGTMTFGAETDEAGAHAQLDRFVEAGGTFVDTADVYSRGVSEEIVGRWLGRSDRSDEVVVATKARMPMGDDANQVGVSRRWLTRALDASLQRLGVERVDLYQVHAWDPLTPIEETLATLDGFVRAGKVGHVGVSNFRGWQLQRACMTADVHGWSPVVTLQPQYNLLAREVEWELVPLCEDVGIGLLPWSPLGGGWLTGKYERDEQPTGATRLGEDPDRGVEAYEGRNTERTWDVLDVVREVADAHDASMAQVAVAWLRAQPAVSSVILGARTVEQLEDNLGAADLDLGADELARLDEVSAPPTPDYPYGMIDELEQARRDQLGPR